MFCCGFLEEKKKPSLVDLASETATIATNGTGRSAESEMESEANANYLDPAAIALHRKTIFSKPFVITDDFTAPVIQKSRIQKAFLADVLRENFLFVDMIEEERDMFILSMEVENFPAGKTIIEQGDVMGDYFYIVSQGTVDFIKDGQHVGSCDRGGSFGELALLYDSPRAATCTAKTDVSVYKVDRNTFRRMLARNADDQQKDVRELIRGISVFKDLDEATLNRFTRAMTPVRFHEGDRIVQKGQVGNVFYIVQVGNVKIHDIGLSGTSRFQDQILRPGDWFGERALITGEPRAANVTAMSDETVLLAMDRSTFEHSIGSLKGLMEIEMRKNFLKGLPLFVNGNITDPELHHLARLMEEKSYPKGTQLALAGKPYDMKLWIIQHGKLLVYTPPKSSGQSNTLKSGDYFGDNCVCGDPNLISQHNAVCEEDLTAWVLSRENLMFVVADLDRLRKSESVKRESLDLEGVTLTLDCWKKLRLLGQGAFGTVWLVKHKELATAYALKCISKRRIIESNQLDSVMRERSFLTTIKHPFILHSHGTFQNDSHLFIVLPVIPGGELFSVLHKQKLPRRGLRPGSAAFYSACIIEALGYFHLRGIAYRDLKLENVLIDEDGYCVLVDLGFAKIVEDKTFTLVGTPEYLAPEIIMSKGHDKAVDYWAFGILCYELLIGVSPFFKDGSSQIEMFRRIVKGKYLVPDYVDNQAADMISKLLQRREMKRLGNLSRGYLDIKAHEWYVKSGIDFQSILKKEFTAPWVPVVKDAFDSSNFDGIQADENEDERVPKTEDQILFKDF